MINRENFQEYFLMYVDNELTAPERKAVEEFAAANEDVREEFEMLNASVLLPDDITFVPKTSLYKTESLENVENALLLYLDNELPHDARQPLEFEMLTNDIVSEEYKLLQKTKLDSSEKIECTFKESLYRREPAKVVTFNFRYVRYAVAALFIGAGLFFGVRLMNAPEDSTGMADINIPKKGIGIKKTDPVQTVPSKDVVSPDLQIASTDNSIEKKNIRKSVANDIAQTKNHVVTNQSKNKIDKVSNKIKDNNVSPEKPVINNQQIQTIDREDYQLAVVKPGSEISKPNEIMNRDMTPRDEVARFANFDESGSNDTFLYMEEEKVSRSKVGGFLRKVKRTVERNTKIKTSDGLRIGGFEIALK